MLVLALLAIGVLAPSALASSQSSASLRGLRPGTTGPGVRHLQKMLAHLGYVVRADGQFGGHTANVGPQLPRRGRSAALEPGHAEVRAHAQARAVRGAGRSPLARHPQPAVGAKGRDVKALQKDLTKLGYPAATDGEFGPQTRVSVRSFERSAGLQIDGVVSAKEARTLKKIAKIGNDAGAVSKTQTTQATPATAAPTMTAAPADPASQVATAPPAVGSIGSDGLAVAPPGAPAAVVAIIAAGNQIAHKPYLYGGGHDQWQDSGYDCSGSVSFALHGAGLISTPMSSYDFPGWGDPGPGQWVTVYGMQSHAYMVVAGLRFDTSASKGGGSRWTTAPRSSAGYVAVHPPGL